jgi:hypothetical protein
MPTSPWESLRLGFMQLRSECAIQPPIANAGRLSALWTAQPLPGRPHWRLNYLNGKDGMGIGRRFEWHSQNAAALLGFTGAGDEAVSFWLDQIKRDAPESHLSVFKLKGGSESADQVYSIEILDICGLSADYCRKCEANEIRLSAAQRIDDTPDLPPQFQDAFATAKINAELSHATASAALPGSARLHLAALIHTVFFAFCREARNACRNGFWTVAQVQESIDEQWPIICNFYLVRELGACSDEDKSNLQATLRQATNGDPQWKQHLSELAALAERTTSVHPDPTGNQYPAETVSQLIAEAAEAGSKFWNGLRKDFLEHAGRFRDLWAQWRARFGVWVPGWESKEVGWDDIQSSCYDLLNAVTRNAITRVPTPAIRTAKETEPWTIWLDFMRVAGKCEPTGSPISVSALEWEAGVKSGKPLAEVQRELGLSTSDEVGAPYAWVQDVRVEQVFQASADFCEVLASHAYEAESRAVEAQAILSTSKERRRRHTAPQENEVAEAEKSFRRRFPNRRAYAASRRKGSRKGDVTLLAGKSLVTFQTAEAYLGISERQRQSLIQQKKLTVKGLGHNKKITTESLRVYLPPENPK